MRGRPKYFNRVNVPTNVKGGDRISSLSSLAQASSSRSSPRTFLKEFAQSLLLSLRRGRLQGIWEIFFLNPVTGSGSIPVFILTVHSQPIFKRFFNVSPEISPQKKGFMTCTTSSIFHEKVFLEILF